MRESASWYIGCSRITELPSGERDEDVVERGVMRGERRELQAPLLQQGEQRGQRAMQLRHGQRESARTGTDGGHTADATDRIHEILGDAVAERELDDVLRAERRDQLARRAERDDFFDGVRLAIKRSKQREHFADGELVGELGFLELNAEPLAQRAPRGAVAPRRPENLDVARVGRRQPLEDLDRGGLPRAVRSEQSEAFAGPDREIETRDGDDVTEAFGQGATVDRYDGSCSVGFSFSGGISWAILSA